MHHKIALPRQPYVKAKEFSVLRAATIAFLANKDRRQALLNRDPTAFFIA
jgi:hypothetical protein